MSLHEYKQIRCKRRIHCRYMYNKLENFVVFDSIYMYHSKRAFSLPKTVTIKLVIFYNLCPHLISKVLQKLGMLENLLDPPFPAQLEERMRIPSMLDRLFTAQL